MLNDPRQFEIRTRTQDCFEDKKKPPSMANEIFCQELASVTVSQRQPKNLVKRWLDDENCY